ncbi:MAG TPA: hypothetical protein VF618_26470 [Thermoanaerobaculia bacterium]
MTISAVPADSVLEKVWMVFGATTTFAKSADDSGKRTPFSTPKPAGPNDADCYTFEAFATSVPDIRSAYHYHYN